MPIGACLYSHGVYSEQYDLRHGSTFGGNTLACRAALATIRELTKDDQRLVRQVAALGQRLQEQLRTVATRISAAGRRRPRSRADARRGIESRPYREEPERAARDHAAARTAALHGGQLSAQCRARAHCGVLHRRQCAAYRTSVDCRRATVRPAGRCARTPAGHHSTRRCGRLLAHLMPAARSPTPSPSAERKRTPPPQSIISRRQRANGEQTRFAFVVHLLGTGDLRQFDPDSGAVQRRPAGRLEVAHGRVRQAVLLRRARRGIGRRQAGRGRSDHAAASALGAPGAVGERSGRSRTRRRRSGGGARRRGGRTRRLQLHHRGRWSGVAGAGGGARDQRQQHDHLGRHSGDRGRLCATRDRIGGQHGRDRRRIGRHRPRAEPALRRTHGGADPYRQSARRRGQFGTAATRGRRLQAARGFSCRHRPRVHSGHVCRPAGPRGAVRLRPGCGCASRHHDHDRYRPAAAPRAYRAGGNQRHSAVHRGGSSARGRDGLRHFPAVQHCPRCHRRKAGRAVAERRPRSGARRRPIWDISASATAPMC